MSGNEGKVNPIGVRIDPGDIIQRFGWGEEREQLFSSAVIAPGKIAADPDIQIGEWVRCETENNGDKQPSKKRKFWRE